MNKVKKIITSPFFAIGAFALAAVLLLSAGIGGASAALNDTSEVYQLDIAMENIGVQVIENRENRSILAKGSDKKSLELKLPNIPKENFELETPYAEVLAVKNTGDISEYVRVIVTKYWEKNGIKLNEGDEGYIDPAYIVLGFDESNGWEIQDNETTAERTVLTYSKEVASGQQTEPFMTTISFANDLKNLYDSETTTTTEEKDGYTYVTTTTTYSFNGVQFVVEVEAQAVQTHNYRDAMISSWGYKPTNIQ